MQAYSQDLRERVLRALERGERPSDDLALIGYSLAGRAVAMKLFPVQKLSQFSGGLNVFNCGGLIIGNVAIGLPDGFSQ